MFTIAQNTIRELIRNKFFSVILFLGVIFILISFALETLALGELERMMYDFGLSFIEITGFSVILFLGGSMIAREIEGRTIFLMLSKPVPRHAIFLGKFIGFAVVIIGMLIFQSVLLILLLKLKAFSLDPLIFPALLGILLKLFALLALILFFSTFTSPIIAMFLTISSYIIGHGGYTMLDYARWDGSPMMGYMGKGILTLFPNLESLNLKNYVATTAPIDISTWYIAFALVAVYIGIILFFGSWVFSKKSFDNA